MKAVRIFMGVAGGLALAVGIFGFSEYSATLDVLLNWLYAVVGVLFIVAALTPSVSDDSWCSRTFGRILVLVALIMLFFSHYWDALFLGALGVVSWIVGGVTREHGHGTFLEDIGWPYGKT